MLYIARWLPGHELRLALSIILMVMLWAACQTLWEALRAGVWLEMDGIAAAFRALDWRPGVRYLMLKRAYGQGLSWQEQKLLAQRGCCFWMSGRCAGEVAPVWPWPDMLARDGRRPARLVCARQRARVEHP